MSELDVLWESANGRANKWTDRLTDEQTEWLGAVADRIVEKDQEPVFAACIRMFKEKWPDAKPPNHTTMADTLRRMVDERQR